MTFSSCEDFLTKVPKTALSPDSFFITASDLELWTNKFYSDLLEDTDIAETFADDMMGSSLSALQKGTRTTSSKSWSTPSVNSDGYISSNGTFTPLMNINYFLEQFRTTLYRQTMFAEFELMMSQKAEAGESLTAEALCAMYFDLNKKYYGRSVISDPEIAYEWARIPHFYRAFYVYKYATGIISAISIAERIYTEGAPAVEDYFKFLSSGGSDSPVELLKLAGVDLTKMDAFNSCMASFKDALEQFEQL